MFWKHLSPHGTEHLPSDDATEAIEKLIARIERDDEEAIAELVRIDPRYLATSFVAAKLLWWRLQVLHGSQHTMKRAPESAASAVGKLQEAAREHLKAVGQALQVVTGRGNKLFVNERALLRHHDESAEAVEEVRALLKTKKSDVEIAKQSGVPAAMVEKLRRHPRQRVAVTYELTLSKYDNTFGTERLRKLLLKARKREQ